MNPQQRIEMHAGFLADNVRRWMTWSGAFLLEDVRPAFALALEALEREGLIPGEAQGLREVKSPEGRHLLIIGRASGEAIGCMSGPTDDDIRHASAEDPGCAFLLFARSMCPICGASQAEARPLADRLKSALKFQGVDLGQDATEAIVRALESLEVEQ